MKRALCISAIFLASGLTVAACSSSPKATFDPRLCALASSCNGTSSLFNFGAECELISAEYALLNENTLGSLEQPLSSELACAAAATDCASLNACSGQKPADASACATSTTPHCEGNLLVSCGANPPTATDCTVSGMTCIQGSVTAQCAMGACDSASTKPSCDGDTLVRCEGGVLQSEFCSSGLITSTTCSGSGTTNNCSTHVGETCGVVGGQAQCVGSGPACDEPSFTNRCDGSVMVTCTGGKIGQFDCTKLGPQVTCRLASDGSAQCAGAGTQCDSTTPETCQNGVITYCMWGTVTTLDCKRYGLSGCATQSGIAQCTP
jgi:hypothetical protein